MVSKKKSLAAILAAGALAFSGKSLGDGVDTNLNVKIKGIVAGHAKLEFIAPASSATNGYIFMRSSDMISGFSTGRNYNGEVKINPTNVDTVVIGYEPTNVGGTNYNWFGLQKNQYSGGQND